MASPLPYISCVKPDCHKHRARVSLTAMACKVNGGHPYYSEIYKYGYKHVSWPPFDRSKWEALDDKAQTLLRVPVAWWNLRDFEEVVPDFFRMQKL